MIQIEVKRDEVVAKCLVGGVGFMTKQRIHDWEYNRVESESQVKQRHIKEAKRMLGQHVAMYFQNLVSEMKHELTNA